MTLSCNFGGDWEWWHRGPQDFAPLAAKRGRRCASCREWIKPGALAVKFECWRAPASYVEERIFGSEEVPMAPKWMCERCGDLAHSLNELGFCLVLGEDMREVVKEYAEVYGKKRGRDER